MKISEVTRILENLAPLALQEPYDNAGLIIGDPDKEVSGIMICLDISHAVITEAKIKNCNLIISHHPVIFNPVKKINNNTVTGKIIVALIKSDIAAYAIHTNLDSVPVGVNDLLAKKLGLINIRFLQPQTDLLRKLVTFCPLNAAEKVRKALSMAGAGSIGNYDSCTFSTEGVGTFRANEKATPYVGEKNVVHHEPEIRIETIFPAYLQQNIIASLLQSHPYEEVAYDIYSLENNLPFAGAGMIGELPVPISEKEFLEFTKKKLSLNSLKYCKGKNKKIHRIALCGGSGSFLIATAMAAGADAFVTADIKYHDFQGTEGNLLLIDAGHFETEIQVKDLLKVVLSEKFPNFVILKSKKEQNPVNYL